MFVTDNFVEDEKLLERILSDNSFFPENMGDGKEIASAPNMYNNASSSTYSPFMFWDGWWKSPADTLKKQLIQLIFSNRINELEVIGFEYWSRTYHVGQYIQPHVDADTELYVKQKELGTPIMGAVWWGIDNPNGGFFELHPSLLERGSFNSLEKENIENLLSPIEDRERIKYVGNRLIIFDAGHQLHGTTVSLSGIKQSFIVNVWGKNDPPLALIQGKFAYETSTPNFGKKYSLSVITPLGDERILISFDTSNMATIEQGNYSCQFAYRYEKSIFTAEYSVDSPMIANVSFRLEESDSTVAGRMKINEYSDFMVVGKRIS